ncbi:MAG: hypothetical protein QNL62_04025 [Gammaproteobacteria bacterium]|nr:hypothetical protein [Gammaproteobacteria bacterium]
MLRVDKKSSHPVPSGYDITPVKANSVSGLNCHHGFNCHQGCVYRNASCGKTVSSEYSNLMMTVETSRNFIREFFENFSIDDEELSAATETNKRVIAQLTVQIIDGLSVA